MKQTITLVFSFLLFSIPTISIAQTQPPPGCDGTRFINEVFSSTMVSIVQYGENLNNGNQEQLIMDIYEPAGDTLAVRPVIIFAHGGYFIFGGRNDMASLCEYFAKRGYVAATIDYRKLPGGTTLNSVNTVEVVVRTMQDMKAAVRYFREDQATDNIYKINPDFIAVGGYSAGAFTALHAAYWDEMDEVPTYMTGIVAAEGGFIGMSSDNLQYSSDIQAVISHSGAIVDTAIISMGEPQAILYHGASDNVVPIGHGTSGGAIVTDGSRIINDKMEALSIEHYYHPVQGGGHGDIFSGAFLNEYNLYLDSAAIVLGGWYCSLDFVSDVDEKNGPDKSRFSISPNPASGEIKIESSDLNCNACKVAIYDVSGHIRLENIFQNQSETLDISSLPPGVYFIEMLHEKGRTMEKIMVY